MMRVLQIALAALALSTVAFAADPPAAGVTIGGQVQTTLKFTADDLRKMSATDVDVTYTTHHGQETGKFTGVLVWSLLEKAVMVDGPGKGAMLRHVITVTGRDGYAVALAAGEIAPDFAGKSVILAYARDGKALKRGEGLRLIVPGDKRAGRAVRDVFAIDVK